MDLLLLLPLDVNSTFGTIVLVASASSLSTAVVVAVLAPPPSAPAAAFFRAFFLLPFGFPSVGLSALDSTAVAAAAVAFSAPLLSPSPPPLEC